MEGKVLLRLFQKTLEKASSHEEGVKADLENTTRSRQKQSRYFGHSTKLITEPRHSGALTSTSRLHYICHFIRGEKFKFGLGLSG